MTRWEDSSERETGTGGDEGFIGSSVPDSDADAPTVVGPVEFIKMVTIDFEQVTPPDGYVVFGGLQVQSPSGALTPYVRDGDLVGVYCNKKGTYLWFVDVGAESYGHQIVQYSSSYWSMGNAGLFTVGSGKSGLIMLNQDEPGDEDEGTGGYVYLYCNPADDPEEPVVGYASITVLYFG